MILRPLLQIQWPAHPRTGERPGNKLEQSSLLRSSHRRNMAGAGKIAPVIMKLRPLLQIQWPAPPPPRAGRTAQRFGAPLTPRLARRPLCGGRRSAVGGRRSAVGGRPVRRGALRLDEIQFQPIFSFNLGTLPNFAPPGEIRGYKLKGILKYISQN